jgi:NCS1 family nucleobase:cation symporter-1
MTTPARTTPNSALVPLSAADRLFGWRDHAALWLSLGVGLLVMQVGSYLVPALGTKAAVLAIVCGSVLGAGLLAWTAKLGCDSGLSSAGLMHACYGSSFARLPVLLNIVQLIGWTTFEIVVMREGVLAIGRRAGLVGPDAAGSPGAAIAASATSAAADPVAAATLAAAPAAPASLVLELSMPLVLVTLAFGALLIALLCGSMVQLVRKFISRFALPLVILSLIWLSWQFLARANTIGWTELWNRTGSGGMSTLSALDLVIAMPISWLPLVADFARHGRDGGSAFRGTWFGYGIANIWCYSLGVLVALTTPGVDLVAALLLAQGGLIALGLILIDEVDNAYGDLYSGSVAGHSLAPGWSLRRWGITLAVACTGFALVLPMHSLEPFLLMLSSVFVPLYGVILGRLAGRREVEGLVGATTVNPGAVAIWLLGVAVFHLLPQVSTQLGSALPTLAITFMLARMSRSPRPSVLGRPA